MMLVSDDDVDINKKKLITLGYDIGVFPRRAILFAILTAWFQVDFLRKVFNSTLMKKFLS